ncbi:MAG: TolC family protein, partial [Nitrospirota bacterium]|jgi:outer membrane protein TolC
MGVVACNELAHRRGLPKPVIAPIVIDPELQGLPVVDGASGVHNLNYLASFKSFRRDVHLFHDIVPFRRLAVLTDGMILETVPALAGLAKTVADELGIAIHPVVAADSAADVLAGLPEDTDAVMVTPLVRMGQGEFAALVAGLIDRRLPSFSLLGREEVEAGLMASAAPRSDFQRLARRIALNLQRILLGEDAATLPVAMTTGERLSINLATARAVGVSLGWRLSTEADLVGEEPLAAGRLLSLSAVIRDAIAANLDVAAQGRAVAAGAEEVRQARARLLPQLDLTAGISQIDEDRANPISRAERETAASLTIEQLLYSDGAWANLEIQGELQRARRQELRALELDIARAATVAYLNVLRAKTGERIQRDNLKTTRSNLDLARIRQAIGTAGPADVYRWESELGTRRREVLAAEAQRSRAELALNRLLHRPLEEVFGTQDATVDDPSLLSSDPRMLDHVKTRAGFSIFRDFLVTEGLRNSPELTRIDAAIAAQRRVVTAARRAYWVPTVGLQGSATETVDRSGTGAAGHVGNDTDWQVGVNLSLPLFQGGARGAELSRAREELAQLELQRQALAERVATGVRTALFATGASYPAIELSRQSATAAHKNLELVTDAYARGVLSILDLLDAQNASLVADQLAATAVYDFLIDMLDAERAAGAFSLLMTPEEREAWLQRLATYFEEHTTATGN